MAAENKSSYYRYMITACDILIPNKDTIRLTTANILGFTIEKDFDNDFFPIFDLKLNINYSQYYTIIENKTTVKFKVKLEKFMYKDDAVINYKETVFDTIFSIFIDDNSSFLDKELYETSVKTLGSVENRITHDFYLFKDNDITSSKKVINRVARRAHMTDCIIYLLSTSGANNVLMSPLENNSIYDDIILPPTTVIQSLKYLEKQYGFYSHGALFFYDFDMVYFINKRAECTAYRTGEYKEVIIQIYKTLNSNAQTPGNFKDTKTKTYTLHISRGNVRMTTESMINEQTEGKNITVVDTKNNTSTTVTPNIQSRNDTNNTIVNNFHNPYLNKMIENAKYENDNIVTLDIYDVDIGCLTPNKKFLLSFEDKSIDQKHKGNYRLNHLLITFTKNGDFFISNGVIQLKKTT